MQFHLASGASQRDSPIGDFFKVLFSFNQFALFQRKSSTVSINQSNIYSKLTDLLLEHSVNAKICVLDAVQSEVGVYQFPLYFIKNFNTPGVYLKCCVQFWYPQNKKTKLLLERVQ